MKINRRNKANPDFSLAAMTDVMVLLLIFFMVTSSVANQSAIDVNLPKGENASTSNQEPMNVSIKPDGTYFVDDVPVKKEDLEKTIVAQLQKNNATSFTIRADQDCLHKDVVFVMEIAEKYKYNIAIATVQDS